MWKWLAGSVLIAAVAVITIHMRESRGKRDCGFVQNAFGERVAWKKEGVITLYLHRSVPREYWGAIQSAADTWEKSAGHKLFNIVSQPLEGPMAPHEDGKNVIYFMDNWEPSHAAEQARTSIYWNGDQIIEADIRVNNKNFQFYWQSHQANRMNVNFEALILHELGHVLGLRHSETGGSVMATYLPSGLDRVKLASTDASNLQCEYQL